MELIVAKYQHLLHTRDEDGLDFILSLNAASINARQKSSIEALDLRLFFLLVKVVQGVSVVYLADSPIERPSAAPAA
jgi:hypothetical protein